MSNPFKNIEKMHNEINEVLSKYGLQIATFCGQFKKPVDITITIEEKGQTIKKYGL